MVGNRDLGEVKALLKGVELWIKQQLDKKDLALDKLATMFALPPILETARK
jgi:hypothetical protein